MLSQPIARALLALVSSVIACLSPTFAAEDIASAERVASELNSLAGASTETKAQFVARTEPVFRRLAARELMAQTLVGPMWNSLSPSERLELTDLYGKVVLRTLHGAFSRAGSAQFAPKRGALYRAKAGAMKERCELLVKEDCVFYTAESKANDIAIEHQLLETNKGWALVDVVVNKQSVHLSYQPQVQESLKVGATHMLQKLTELVARP